MTLVGDAFEAGLQIADALESHGVSYALGGALAYGQHGIPRATNDVDVNVFVEVDSLGPVFVALQSLGISSMTRRYDITRTRKDCSWCITGNSE